MATFAVISSTFQYWIKGFRHANIQSTGSFQAPLYPNPY